MTALSRRSVFGIDHFRPNSDTQPKFLWRCRIPLVGAIGLDRGLQPAENAAICAREHSLVAATIDSSQ
jgi:hypothetical protein